ncbi:MAG: DUF2058 family protein [Planctomycetota bacterium]|nr:DUF2058 family protein [Planctomycetota bacterium]
MGKKDKKKKKNLAEGSLMAGLVNAGFLSEKGARKIRREQRVEQKEVKKEHGHKGIEELQRQKQLELIKLAEEKKAQTQAAEKLRKAQERQERIQLLTRDRIHCGGNRRFYFRRKDKVIDFVDVDPNIDKQLGFREVAIVHGENNRPGDYLILPVNSKLHELRSLAEDMVLYPSF